MAMPRQRQEIACEQYIIL